jgi:hypothetical protein
VTHIGLPQEARNVKSPAFKASETGVWNGPVASAYGLHLVRVSELTPGRQREFSEVKAQVLERWRDEQQRESSARYFAGLLKKYSVAVDESVKPLIGALDGALPAPQGGEEIVQ